MIVPAYTAARYGLPVLAHKDVLLRSVEVPLRAWLRASPRMVWDAIPRLRLGSPFNDYHNGWVAGATAAHDSELAKEYQRGWAAALTYLETHALLPKDEQQ